MKYFLELYSILWKIIFFIYPILRKKFFPISTGWSQVHIISKNALTFSFLPTYEEVHIGYHSMFMTVIRRSHKIRIRIFYIFFVEKAIGALHLHTSDIFDLLFLLQFDRPWLIFGEAILSSFSWVALDSQKNSKNKYLTSKLIFFSHWLIVCEVTTILIIINFVTNSTCLWTM